MGTVVCQDSTVDAAVCVTTSFFVNVCVCVCDWAWLLSLHTVTDLEPVWPLCSKFLCLGEPLIHVIRTVRVAAVLTKDCSLWISIYLNYRTWLHWHRTPLNTITLTDKETRWKLRHQAKNAMRSATFSNGKIYILSPIQQAGQSRSEFQSFYSILFDWEGRWGILSSRDPAIHAHETELSSALLSHPVTTVHFYYPEYAPVSTAQHTKHTHLRAQHVQITFLVNRNISNALPCLFAKAWSFGQRSTLAFHEAYLLRALCSKSLQVV